MILVIENASLAFLILGLTFSLGKTEEFWLQLILLAFHSGSKEENAKILFHNSAFLFFEKLYFNQVILLLNEPNLIWTFETFYYHKCYFCSYQIIWYFYFFGEYVSIAIQQRIHRTWQFLWITSSILYLTSAIYFTLPFKFETTIMWHSCITVTGLTIEIENVFLTVHITTTDKKPD